MYKFKSNAKLYFSVRKTCKFYCHGLLSLQQTLLLLIPIWHPTPLLPAAGWLLLLTVDSDSFPLVANVFAFLALVSCCFLPAACHWCCHSLWLCDLLLLLSLVTSLLVTSVTHNHSCWWLLLSTGLWCVTCHWSSSPPPLSSSALLLSVSTVFSFYVIFCISHK